MIPVETIYRSYQPGSNIGDAVKDAVKAATIVLELDVKDTFVEDLFSQVKIEKELQKPVGDKKRYGVAYILTLRHLKRITKDEYTYLLATL